MDKIKQLTDMVSIGIELKKQKLPNGYIHTFWIDKDVRTAIYAELFDNNIEATFWQIEKTIFSGYQFKILGMNFLMISQAS